MVVCTYKPHALDKLECQADARGKHLVSVECINSLTVSGLKNYACYIKNILWLCIWHLDFIFLQFCQ